MPIWSACGICQVLLFTCWFGYDMEPSREYISFYIYTRYKLGFRARPVHEELLTVYGDRPPSFCTVARWIQHFSDGRESVKDEARVGRPRTSVTYSSVERAEVLIVEDSNYNTQILSFGAWCKLRKCTCYRPWAAWSVQEMRKMDLPPVDNIRERTMGGNLSQLVARIWAKSP